MQPSMRHFVFGREFADLEAAMISVRLSVAHVSRAEVLDLTNPALTCQKLADQLQNDAPLLAKLASSMGATAEQANLET